MNDRPIVVVVLLEAAFPPRGGIGSRLKALVEEIAPHADITVLSCLPATAGPQQLPAGIAHARLTRPSGKLGSLLALLAAAVAGRPLTSAFYRRVSLRRPLSRRLNSLEPDLLVVHGIGGAVLVQGLFPPERTVVDLADAEHERVLAVGAANGLRGLPYRLDGDRIARWAGRHLADYRLVSVVSPQDRASYVALSPGARIALAPNGVRLGAVERRPVAGQCLFLGDLKYAPNRESLYWFISQVLPGAESVKELRVVGQGVVPGDDARITRCGFVKDLTAEWSTASCLIVPIRIGGGTRIKVLEAFGVGVPVLSTAFGVGGLGALPGEHYLQAETVAEFHEQLRSLTADPSEAHQVSLRARRLVEQGFSWERCFTPVVAAMVGAAAPHRCNSPEEPGEMPA